jgi:hypothetical protein
MTRDHERIVLAILAAVMGACFAWFGREWARLRKAARDPRGGWPTWEPKTLPDTRVSAEQWADACTAFDEELSDIVAELDDAIETAREQLQEAKDTLEEERRDLEDRGVIGPRPDLVPPLLGEKALREKEEEIAGLREEIDRLRAERGYR